MGNLGIKTVVYSCEILEWEMENFKEAGMESCTSWKWSQSSDLVFVDILVNLVNLMAVRRGGGHHVDGNTYG